MSVIGALKHVVEDGVVVMAIPVFSGRYTESCPFKVRDNPDLQDVHSPFDLAVEVDNNPR